MQAKLLRYGTLVIVLGMAFVFASFNRVYADSQFNVITRAGWGADESLRYWTPELLEYYKTRNTNVQDKENLSDSMDPCKDFAARFADETAIVKTTDYSPNGEQLIWPLQYAKTIRKIIIHHTDSEIRDLNNDNRINSRDYKEFVRAIYRFHAVTKGWGDIGYNYLIDPLGNIYEGRYGGDKVVGGHTVCYNTGSLGIALIGDYETDEVSEAAMLSIIYLVAQKSRQYQIDTEGESDFRGKKLPNILAHRDAGKTACPGKNLYAALPRIRERAAFMLHGGGLEKDFLSTPLDYNAEPESIASTLELKPYERKKLTIRFKNIGLLTWNENTWLHVPLNNNPNARAISIIPDKIFVAANLKEPSVPPGSTGTFEMEVEAGYAGGEYALSVAPVINGRYRVSRATVTIPMNIEKPLLDYEIAAQNLPQGTIFQGQKLKSWIELKNTGNVTWRSYGPNSITLGTESPRDHKSIFVTENPARIGYLLDTEVAPGETGRFAIELEVPENIQKRVVERFTPVIEGIGWLKDQNMGFSVTIKKPHHLAQMEKLNPPTQMPPGEMKKIEIKMKNKGDIPWDAESMAITVLGRGIKVFKSRLIPNNPVATGQNAVFSFWVQAPYQAGKNSIWLTSRFNRTSIRGGSARFVINTPDPRLRAQLEKQEKRSFKLQPGEIKELTVKFKNIGNIVWQKEGPNAIYLAPAKPHDRKSALTYEHTWINPFRAAKLRETEVRPGETGTFIFNVQPSVVGQYREYFELVIEQVGWIQGSLVRWDFDVSGEALKGETKDKLSDARENASKAEIITKAKQYNAITGKNNETAAVEETKSSIGNIGATPFRVKLSYSGEQALIRANGPYKAIGDEQAVLFDIQSGDTVSVRSTGQNLSAQYQNISKTSAFIRFVPQNDNTIMEIASWEHRPSWNLELNDNQFRGTIEVRLVNDAITFINELPLEYYLRGLAEVSNDAHLEKQKAIAVLARTYARFYMQEENRKFPSLPYDGSDDPDIFQRYLGYGFEKRSPNFVGAAALTANEVVTYQGKLVKTPYFNQSDGRTRSAKEVWGWTNTSYLVSVPDPWCSGLEKKGHGVGLSGCGAEAQAKEGKTYDEIIKYYYQGVEVEEVKLGE